MKANVIYRYESKCKGSFISFHLYEDAKYRLMDIRFVLCPILIVSIKNF